MWLFSFIMLHFNRFSFDICKSLWGRYYCPFFIQDSCLLGSFCYLEFRLGFRHFYFLFMRCLCRLHREPCRRVADPRCSRSWSCSSLLLHFLHCLINRFTLHLRSRGQFVLRLRISGLRSCHGSSHLKVLVQNFSNLLILHWNLLLFAQSIPLYWS
jgi:hypothetical protein